MKILHLTIKKKWFDMIASGEKKEEYREVKKHWIQRLTWHEYHTYPHLNLIPVLANGKAIKKHFYDAVEFRNGYSKDAPTILVELTDIHYGYPARYEWADYKPDNWYFCLVLGRVNYTQAMHQEKIDKPISAPAHLN